MKPLALVAALAPLALCGAAAAGAPQVATAEKHGTPLIPAKLSGSTDGKAKLDVGLGYSFGLDNHELSFSVIGSVATKDGKATIFSTTDAGTFSQSVPWSLGASISLASLRRRWRPDLASVKHAAFDTCDLACTSDPSDAFCKTRLASLKRHLTRRKTWPGRHPETMRPEMFCTSQRDAVRAVELPPEQPWKPEDPLGRRVKALFEQQRLSVREKAIDACLQECADDPTEADEFCKGDVAAARAQIWHDYSSHELCAEGVKRYDEAEEKVGRAKFPAWYLNAGFNVGRQEYRYRQSDGTTANNLLAHDDFVAPWSAGVAYINLPKVGRYDPTFEVQGILSSSYTAAAATVKSCKPAGNVPRTEPKAGAAVGDTDPAQICEDATLGAPTKTTGATIVFRFGVVDGSNATWRAAIGPEVTIPWSNGKVQTPDLAVRVPIYASLAAFEKLDYKGIIQLTPALVVANKPDGTRDVKVLLEVALLGQRRLFSDRFDNL